MSGGGNVRILYIYREREREREREINWEVVKPCVSKVSMFYLNTVTTCKTA